MGRSITMALASVLLVVLRDLPLAAGFLPPPPNPATARVLLHPWPSPSPLPSLKKSRSDRCPRTLDGTAAAPLSCAGSSTFPAAATTPKGSRSEFSWQTRRTYHHRATTTTSCSSSSGGAGTGSAPASDERSSSPSAERLHDAAGGGVGAGSAPSAVIAAEDDSKEQEGGSSESSSTSWRAAETIPVALGQGGGGKADAVDQVLGYQFEWEAGAPWAEFEDWLLQDTYSRYVIGSGRHVLWRRMVREVPELMERTPQEARERWLRLTGKLGEGAAGARESVPGCPPLDSFYLQPPVLEQWEEVVEGDGMGSFRGNVFGQKGLADGTAMTTAPVDVAGRRIQDQYVATQCGVVYELGEGRATDLVGKASSKLLKIAPVTLLALSTAFYAFSVLSHHIQVEVFVI